MKKNKIFLLSSFLLASSILVACSEDSKEKVETIDEVKTEDVSKQETKKANKEEVSKSIPEGYKMGGYENSGYILIPEDFANFVDVNTTSKTIKQYSNGIGSFIITLNETNSELTLETAKDSMLNSLGETAKVDKKTISGYNSYEIFNYYEDENYSLYIYLIDTPKGVKYMSIEFSGKDDGTREKVLETYSLEPYVEEKSEVNKEEKSEVKKPEVETNKSNENTEDKLSSLSKDLKVKQISKNSAELIVSGNFKEGTEYIVSLYSSVQIDGLGIDRIKASKVDGAIVLKGEIQSESDFSPATYNIVIMNGDDYSLVSNDLEFIYK